ATRFSCRSNVTSRTSASLLGRRPNASKLLAPPRSANSLTLSTGTTAQPQSSSAVTNSPRVFSLVRERERNADAHQHGDDRPLDRTRLTGLHLLELGRRQHNHLLAGLQRVLEPGRIIGAGGVFGDVLLGQRCRLGRPERLVRVGRRNRNGRSKRTGNQQF